jgi:hypothetical protein
MVHKVVEPDFTATVPVGARVNPRTAGRTVTWKICRSSLPYLTSSDAWLSQVLLAQVL